MITVLPVEKLQAVAAMVKAPPAKPSTSSNGNGAPFTNRLDVPRWLKDRGVGHHVKDRPDSKGRTVYVLDVCPFDGGHGGNGEVSVMQWPDGKLAAACMHNSCTGRGWQEFKTAIGPPDANHWDPPRSDHRHNGSSKPRPVAPLTPGTRVRAKDKGNIGEIISDNGNSCLVHFRNPLDGATADVDLPKSQLRALDGQPLDGEQAEPIPPPIALPALLSAHSTLRPPVVDGLLRVGETMNLVAAPKKGKSWLIYIFALCIVAGRKWLGTFDCLPSRVLLLDAELHVETIAYRLRTVAAAMNIGPEYLSYIDVAPLRGLGADLLRLRPFIESLERGRYAVVIADAWYRFLPLGYSENDNAQVMALYNMIDTYADLLGAAWVNVHHASKGDQSGKSTTDVGSGAGSQSRAADSHLIIRQHEQADVAVIEAVVRSWPPVQPLAIRWAYPLWELAADADPRKLLGPRTARDRASRENRDIHLDEDRQAIVNAMVAEPGLQTQTEIRNAARIGNPRFGFAWASLIADGTIVPAGETIKGNNRRYDAFTLSHQETDQ
jgi:hypothetical protein